MEMFIDKILFFRSSCLHSQEINNIGLFQPRLCSYQNDIQMMLPFKSMTVAVGTKISGAKASVVCDSIRFLLGKRFSLDEIKILSFFLYPSLLSAIYIFGNDNSSDANEYILL